MATIRVENLGKRYFVSDRSYGSLALKEYVQDIFSLNMTSKREHWGLRNVSFEAEEGEVIGLVGPNGSGKTTLLNLISQITEPTEGRIEYHGRLGALLGANTGFHSELNVVDNIFLASSIMGFGKSDISSNIEKIIDLAGLEGFVYEPIKHLSSGMQMKLGLSVVMAVVPEIVILDEVVGTLDEAFRRKLSDFIADEILGKRTAIVVNHDKDFIQRNCTTIIELEHGKCKNIYKNRK
ncbi:MAG: ABC transporter ATP-binding protein [Proteobacteria bacterium]|jgi:lipopolysaccharide transport system ATP-binding protein|nr:ABC transporter ATP-binding protein [Pseudomonadota bacterium]